MKCTGYLFTNSAFVYQEPPLKFIIFSHATRSLPATQPLPHICSPLANRHGGAVEWQSRGCRMSRKVLDGKLTSSKVQRMCDTASSESSTIHKAQRAHKLLPKRW